MTVVRRLPSLTSTTVSTVVDSVVATPLTVVDLLSVVMDVDVDVPVSSVGSSVTSTVRSGEVTVTDFAGAAPLPLPESSAGPATMGWFAVRGAAAAPFALATAASRLASGEPMYAILPSMPTTNAVGMLLRRAACIHSLAMVPSPSNTMV